jgi:uncharacterized glyoxalase superfamily protein PhnB
MRPRISVLTLGVEDLERAVAFYRDGLGLPTKGIVGREFEYGAVACFDLQSSLRLAVWGQDNLAHDTGLPKTARCPTEFSIGQNVSSKSEVDDVIEQACKAGATILTEAQVMFYGGYGGYFQDPDGHVWEIV